MKIGLIGAFDRFNYGDVLFPLIVEEEVKKRIPNSVFYYYAMEEKDLTNYGGKITRSLSKMNKDKIDVAIVVGGEVLVSNWSITYIHTLQNRYKIFANRVLIKLFSEKFVETRSRKLLNQIHSSPWIIDKDSFNVKKVVYNTVSGTNFSGLSEKIIFNIKKGLEQADYISVRDPKTYENLSHFGISSIQEYPDSAFIMSKQFCKEKLFNMISKDFKDYYQKKFSDKKYIVFQIGSLYAKGNISKIVSQMRMFRENYPDLEILLLPISNAGLHDDASALKLIQSEYNSKFGEVFPFYLNPSIFDIMFSIANSKLFIGTSLHGNITALSYCVPSVGLDERVTKLSEFLKSYSISNQLYGVDYSNIFNSIEKSMLISNSKLEGNANRIFKLIEENFNNICEVIIE